LFRNEQACGSGTFFRIQEATFGIQVLLYTILGRDATFVAYNLEVRYGYRMIFHIVFGLFLPIRVHFAGEKFILNSLKTYFFLLITVKR
jgi:hypothetical protein